MTTTNDDADDTDRVAVIDDEPEIGDIIRRALRRNYQLDLFERAEDALAALEEGNRYAAILCDLYMPEISGRDIYNEVSERWPAQAERMVFMSGVSSEGARQDLLEGLDVPMLEKPFRLRQLRDAVSDIVEGR